VDVDDTLADLVRAHSGAWVRVAYQLTHEPAAAHDVVQEALISVCRNWRRRGVVVDHPSAYVRRAIVNEFLRRERARRPDDLIAAAPDQPALSKQMDDAIADHDRMWRALGKLPARQRAVLVLRYYEDLPDPQIADVLGCRRATVRSLAARGLAALRPLIGSEKTDVMEGNPR